MKPTVLEIRNLSVNYRVPGGEGLAAEIQVVRDVSLSLGAGELVGLAGESGCGKSTLAHAVARLLPGNARVTAGDVIYRPDDAAQSVLALSGEDLRQFRWRKLSMIFQSAMNSLNPVLRIEAQLSDAIRAHDKKVSKAQCRERGAELLDLVGVGAARLRSYPHELSGGMRQRTMLAMALALNPEIVLMDEPTTALDVVVQREILDEVRALQERLGFAVLFITHDLSLLLDLADRVAVMYAGRLMEQAPVSALIDQPAHPYTAALLHSFPTVDGPRGEDLVSIGGSPPTPPLAGSGPDGSGPDGSGPEGSGPEGRGPAGCPFQPRCSYAFDDCAAITPSLTELASGSSVACLKPLGASHAV
jgi:peptide/nickel transport system ATP-binding protein